MTATRAVLLLVIDRLTRGLESRRSGNGSRGGGPGLRCFCCDGGFRPTNYRRIPANTRLERFLAARRIGDVPLQHSLYHVSQHYGFSSLHGPTLLLIRKGAVRVDAERGEMIRLGVANLLGEPVALAELFDPAGVGQ